jgi:hypothetical protein
MMIQIMRSLLITQCALGFWAVTKTCLPKHMIFERPMGNYRLFALGEWDARISWALAVLDCVVVWISAWRPIGPILQGARMVALRLAISF